MILHIFKRNLSISKIWFLIGCKIHRSWIISLTYLQEFLCKKKKKLLSSRIRKISSHSFLSTATCFLISHYKVINVKISKTWTCIQLQHPLEISKSQPCLPPNINEGCFKGGWWRKSEEKKLWYKYNTSVHQQIRQTTKTNWDNILWLHQPTWDSITSFVDEDRPLAEPTQPSWPRRRICLCLHPRSFPVYPSTVEILSTEVSFFFFNVIQNFPLWWAKQ